MKKWQITMLLVVGTILAACVVGPVPMVVEPAQPAPVELAVPATIEVTSEPPTTFPPIAGPQTLIAASVLPKCWPLDTCSQDEIRALTCDEAKALAKFAFIHNRICEEDFNVKNYMQIVALIERLKQCGVNARVDEQNCLVIEYGSQIQPVPTDDAECAQAWRELSAYQIRELLDVRIVNITDLNELARVQAWLRILDLQKCRDGGYWVITLRETGTNRHLGWIVVKL